MNYRLISPVISSFVIFSDMYSGLYFQDLQVCVISDVHEIFFIYVDYFIGYRYHTAKDKKR